MYNSLLYWNRFFARLENELNIILVKPRAQNISLVKFEYGEMHNELAQDCNAKGQRYRIYATEDGKLWMDIDNSFNLNEAEWRHPETAKQDTKLIVAAFNDYRDKKAPLPSEMLAIQYESQRQVLELTNLQLREMEKKDFYAENLKSHVGAIVELRDQVKRLGEAVRSREEVTIKVSSRHRHDAVMGAQRSLVGFF